MSALLEFLVESIVGLLLELPGLMLERRQRREDAARSQLADGRREFQLARKALLPTRSK